MTTENTNNAASKPNSRAVGDTRMVCDHNMGGVRYAAQRCTGFDPKGDLVWEEYDFRVFNLSGLPETFTDGDELRTLAGYGLRAWLADRTSQFRKLGPQAVLEAMDSYFADCLQKGQWAMKKATAAKAPRLDPALVAVIAKMKSIPHATAETALAQLDAGALAAIAAKLGDAIAAERAAMAEAAAGLDLGDLL